MNDMELTEALKGLYTGKDNSSPERELNERLRELDASARDLGECEKYYMFAPAKEVFEVAEGIALCIDYKNKAIYVTNERTTDGFIRHEQVSLPFEVMARLIHFLGWLVDSRDVGKE